MEIGKEDETEETTQKAGSGLMLKKRRENWRSEIGSNAKLQNPVSVPNSWHITIITTVDCQKCKRKLMIFERLWCTFIVSHWQPLALKKRGKKQPKAESGTPLKIYVLSIKHSPPVELKGGRQSFASPICRLQSVWIHSTVDWPSFYSKKKKSRCLQKLLKPLLQHKSTVHHYARYVQTFKII